MDDAETLLKKKDGSQAGEKLWGTAAEAVKAIAARVGKPIRTHADLWNFVLSLDKENPRLELRRLFAVADHPHSNFYEDEIPFDAVQGIADDVREFIAKLEDL
jgi:hypothetical protein